MDSCERVPIKLLHLIACYSQNLPQLVLGTYASRRFRCSLPQAATGANSQWQVWRILGSGSQKGFRTIRMYPTGFRGFLDSQLVSALMLPWRLEVSPRFIQPALPKKWNRPLQTSTRGQAWTLAPSKRTEFKKKKTSCWTPSYSIMMNVNKLEDVLSKGCMQNISKSHQSALHRRLMRTPGISRSLGHSKFLQVWLQKPTCWTCSSKPSLPCSVPARLGKAPAAIMTWKSPFQNQGPGD